VLLGSTFFPNSTINDKNDGARLIVQFIRAMAPKQLTDTAAIINASHVEITKP